MAEFQVLVRRINQPVVKHPNADRLTIVRIGGYECIANLDENGQFRYKEGDLVVYIPEGGLVPEWLLKKQGMWDETKGKGILAGSGGNRVKAKLLRGIFSQGILYPVNFGNVLNLENENCVVSEGDNVADILGITKWEPPIPTSMAGELAHIGTEYTTHFDLESVQKFDAVKSHNGINYPLFGEGSSTNTHLHPDVGDDALFDIGEPIVITEKIHGTNCQIGYIPGLNHPEMFGKDGCIYVASKGLAAKGLVFKNNDANNGNLYVCALRQLLNNGLEDRLKSLPTVMDAPEGHLPAKIHIIGEIFGQGVQDLTYGFTKPEFRVFTIKINGQHVNRQEGARVDFDWFEEMATFLGLKTVPVLYKGPYTSETLLTHRDGMDSLSGTHIREGIVIDSLTGARHPKHGRKSAKFVSPDYLLRNNKDATEYS